MTSGNVCYIIADLSFCRSGCKISKTFFIEDQNYFKFAIFIRLYFSFFFFFRSQFVFCLYVRINHECKRTKFIVACNTIAMCLQRARRSITIIIKCRVQCVYIFSSIFQISRKKKSENILHKIHITINIFLFLSSGCVYYLPNAISIINFIPFYSRIILITIQ